jgi:hypothetical protein
MYSAFESLFGFACVALLCYPTVFSKSPQVIFSFGTLLLPKIHPPLQLVMPPFNPQLILTATNISFRSAGVHLQAYGYGTAEKYPAFVAR